MISWKTIEPFHQVTKSKAVLTFMVSSVESETVYVSQNIIITATNTVVSFMA